MSFFYVIAPVGADPAFGQKKNILADVGALHDIRPFFPLDHHTKFSPADAIADLRRADLVIADLSRERPSCYYELGLAEAAGATVVLIAETGTCIHQVGSPSNFKFYSDLTEYRLLLDEVLGTHRRVSVR